MVLLPFPSASILNGKRVAINCFLPALSPSAFTQGFSARDFNQGFQLKISSTCTFVSCHSKQTRLRYHQELPKCVYFPVTKLNTATEDCSIQCPSNSNVPEV